ncbi:MAG: hypothetical protein KME05_08115 [Gloeocapsa sp. UFS-A4-WI-NPMV-4B04]|jgi:hypothetical protein|nr:hypothetical protein [Gloeocapsa sp. UFS-A4-WI-NPMV-4B04]
MKLNTIKNFFQAHPTLAWFATAVIFPPLGAYGVWKYTNCHKGFKVILSIYAAIYTLGAVGSALTNPPESDISAITNPPESDISAITNPPESDIPTIPSITPSPVQSNMQLSCKDFINQADAQESFNSGNRFNLEDNDGDDIACEETVKYNSEKASQELLDERQAEQNLQDKPSQYVSAIEENLNQFPTENQEYGLGILAAWTRDDVNLQAAYKLDCEDVKSGEQWVDNPEADAESAYELNGGRYPLNQFQAWYKARSQAIKEVGCD